ncbi:hypothetical protein [Lysobacter capsici]|uniref:hypothetical protein n=1 Tax=Lysobacter capsici TaxID=435897 RepID=UPI001C0074E9|nr:hypothetical protein [Lysobacter capsici]QWF18576.1 hypothetical protein KME82_07465 [Lysobacter capsici]
MKAANWVQDSVRALPRYLLVLAAVSALALLARAAAPSASARSASALPASALSASPLFASPAPVWPEFASGICVAPAYVSGAAVSTLHAVSGPADAAFAGRLAARTPAVSRAAAYSHEHDALVAALSQRASSLPGGLGVLRRDEVSPSAAARFNIAPGDPRAPAAAR